ncbi:TetR/AcrR family transcriptional regulator [Streptomyces sp. NPDC048523]|uniref:TetR/AcrR family transcriptional regulator n=1 Tax=Streptomyces sp. NPDC048523 TaxID=3365567 RepID=UPI0037100345
MRRQKIIDVAAELFARQGYAATSVNDLGRAVGLAKGALYYYIGSKEKLLVEIQSRVMGPLLSRTRQIAELDTEPLLRLRLLSESLLTVIFRRLDHIRVYEHDHRSLSGPELKTLLGQRSDFEDLISGLLAEAVDQGTFRELALGLATLQFLNLHNHTYQWVKRDGPWDAPFLCTARPCSAASARPVTLCRRSRNRPRHAARPRSGAETGAATRIRAEHVCREVRGPVAGGLRMVSPATPAVGEVAPSYRAVRLAIVDLPKFSGCPSRGRALFFWPPAGQPLPGTGRPLHRHGPRPGRTVRTPIVAAVGS